MAEKIIWDIDGWVDFVQAGCDYNLLTQSIRDKLLSLKNPVMTLRDTIISFTDGDNADKIMCLPNEKLYSFWAYGWKDYANYSRRELINGADSFPAEWILYEGKLNPFLDKFSKEVRKNRYKKIDYQTWRALAGSNTKSQIAVRKRCWIIKIYKENSKIVEESHLFLHNDNSFGTFLTDAYILKKYKMPMKVPEEVYGGQNMIYAENVENTWPRLSENWTDGITLNDTTSPLISNTWSDNMDAIPTLDSVISTATEEDTTEEREHMNLINFDFGPVAKDAVRMSPYGMAIRNTDGIYVAYDAVNARIMDVDVFNFDASRFIYKMPVALDQVKPGDVVIHHRCPMFVNQVNLDGHNLTVTDIYNGEIKSIIPVVNMFNFNFVTKLVNMINMGTPTEDQPFGNMWPLLMMDNQKDDNLMMLALMMNQSFDFANNPMMMMALMGTDNKDNMLPLMLMMNQSQKQ